METRLRMLCRRLENIALVAEDVGCPTQMDDMREAIRILFNFLGTVLVHLRQGTLDTANIFTSDMLPLIAEEQRSVARQAIQSAQWMAIFAYRDRGQDDHDEEAKQLGAALDRELELATSLEGLAEFETQLMEKAEDAALAEAQAMGQATARLEVIEAMLAVVRRGN
jgi:hypothetical protein